MYERLFDRVLQDSSINFPRVDLDPTVWENEDGYYFLREEVKDIILALLDKYPDEDLLQRAREIRVVGSIGSNLYLDETDIDVHIIPEDFSKWNEERVKQVMDWYKENVSFERMIGKHSIEVYVQLDPRQDLLSVSLYDVLEDTWIVGPKIVPLDYDPYKEFSHLADDIRSVFQEADLTIAELRRDVIDYDVIRQAMERLPGEQRKRLLQRLKTKLEEIEKGVEKLYAERGKMVDIRFLPGTSKEAMKDVEQAQRWKNANAIFKFADRYQYLRAIGDLEELLKDDGVITPNEIDIIKGTLGQW
jgi:hypothetical protein